jgi:hypothetical protein
MCTELQGYVRSLDPRLYYRVAPLGYAVRAICMQQQRWQPLRVEAASASTQCVPHTYNSMEYHNGMQESYATKATKRRKSTGFQKAASVAPELEVSWHLAGRIMCCPAYQYGLHDTHVSLEMMTVSAGSERPKEVKFGSWW